MDDGTTFPAHRLVRALQKEWVAAMIWHKNPRRSKNIAVCHSICGNFTAVTESWILQRFHELETNVIHMAALPIRSIFKMSGEVLGWIYLVGRRQHGTRGIHCSVKSFQDQLVIEQDTQIMWYNVRILDFLSGQKFHIWTVIRVNCCRLCRAVSRDVYTRRQIPQFDEMVARPAAARITNASLDRRSSIIHRNFDSEIRHISLPPSH
jgi:hypothetical protein